MGAPVLEMFSHIFPAAALLHARGWWAWGVDFVIFYWSLMFLVLESMQIHFIHHNKHSGQGAKEFH